MERTKSRMAMASLVILSALAVGSLPFLSERGIGSLDAKIAFYGLTLDSDNKVTSGSAESATSGSGTARTKSSGEVSFAYTDLFNTDASFATFQAGGSLWNSSPIRGLKSIEVTSETTDWSFDVYYSYSAEAFSAAQGSLSSASSRFTFDSAAPNYFKIVATGSSNIKAISIDLTYDCLGVRNSVDVSINDATMGSVSGSGVYCAGDLVTLIASPNEGYQFSGWYLEGALVSSSASDTFLMPASGVSLEARFKKRIQTGDLIQYGSYPQDKVTDDSLIASLNDEAGDLPTSSDSKSWTSYCYYASSSISNYMWYQDIDTDGDGRRDYRGVYFDAYRPYITNGSSSTLYSYQDNNGYTPGTVYWFSYDPIDWKVLSISGSDLFVVSDRILDIQDFYWEFSGSKRSATDYQGNTADAVWCNNYQYSNIRAFLNTTFLNTAFTREEQLSIPTTTVDNSIGTTFLTDEHSSYICDDTSDKVYLLSYQEAYDSTLGFDSDSSRIAHATDYALCQGCWQRDSASPWMLRSPHDYDQMAVTAISQTGATDRTGSSYVTDGTRPAMHIALDE